MVWDGDGGAVEKWVPFGAILGGRKNWFDESVNVEWERIKTQG